MDFETDIAIIQEALEKEFSKIKPKPRIHVKVNELGYGLDVRTGLLRKHSGLFQKVSRRCSSTNDMIWSLTFFNAQ